MYLWRQQICEPLFSGFAPHVARVTAALAPLDALESGKVQGFSEALFSALLRAHRKRIPYKKLLLYLYNYCMHRRDLEGEITHTELLGGRRRRRGLLLPARAT